VPRKEIFMDSSTFWAIIDEAAKKSKGDQDKFLSIAGKKLKALGPDGIVGFQSELRRELHRLYSWEVWGAAYLWMGGCSDDGFEYFRLWLIAQGKETVEKILKSPDDLATLKVDDPEECEFESLLYLASEIYEEVAEDEMPDSDDAIAVGDDGELPGPSGKQFDFDDDARMAKKYPKIAAMVNGDGDDDEDDDD
jgi:hypothetical protein